MPHREKRCDAGRTLDARAAGHQPGRVDVATIEGFERGIWMHHQDMGTAVMVFDTQAYADAAVGAVQPPPVGPTVTSCAVHEVARQV
jgi:hypothetical protein